MKNIIIYIQLLTILLSASIKEEDVEIFLLSRYSGDTSNVAGLLSNDFIYEHTPYIGLGIETYYVDESLIITNVLNDSIQNKLSLGDKIFEHNNKIVDSLGLVINGPIGQKQKLIVVKAGERDFREMEVELNEYFYEQNLASFLENILEYSTKWYDFDITINDIVKKKDKIAVNYRWEGSKKAKGEIFTFSAMEILYVNKKTDLIYKITGVWSEKQFRDQFN